jgi:hypothetical protein
MSRYVITNDETKSTKKALKKFSNAEIPDYVNRVRGSFKIVNYRKYTLRNEVDVEFNGEIRVVYNHFDGPEWHNSTLYLRNMASKIKINRFIKKLIFNEVKDHAAYFGIDIGFFDDIKKIKWV